MTKALAARETLLEFPCQFPIKVMGKADVGLDHLTIEIIERHAPTLAAHQIRIRNSGKGRYIAITIDLQATSLAQLDAIYQELSAHELVLMAL